MVSVRWRIFIYCRSHTSGDPTPDSQLQVHFYYTDHSIPTCIQKPPYSVLCASGGAFHCLEWLVTMPIIVCWVDIDAISSGRSGVDNLDSSIMAMVCASRKPSKAVQSYSCSGGYYQPTFNRKPEPRHEILYVLPTIGIGTQASRCHNTYVEVNLYCLCQMPLKLS